MLLNDTLRIFVGNQYFNPIYDGQVLFITHEKILKSAHFQQSGCQKVGQYIAGPIVLKVGGNRSLAVPMVVALLHLWVE